MLDETPEDFISCHVATWTVVLLIVHWRWTVRSNSPKARFLSFEPKIVCDVKAMGAYIEQEQDPCWIVENSWRFGHEKSGKFFGPGRCGLTRSKSKASPGVIAFFYPAKRVGLGLWPLSTSCYRAMGIYDRALRWRLLASSDLGEWNNSATATTKKVTIYSTWQKQNMSVYIASLVVIIKNQGAVEVNWEDRAEQTWPNPLRRNNRRVHPCIRVTNR